MEYPPNFLHHDQKGAFYSYLGSTGVLTALAGQRLAKMLAGRQQIDMMFDCPIFAMQATLEGIGITTWDCPQCKRWRKPSEFERRRNERYEQEKQKKEKGALSQ